MDMVKSEDREKNNLIAVKNVSRVFPVPGGEFRALNNINVEIPKGTFVILKGRSGSGKTTLMNLIGTLDDPTEGEIFFDGRKIGDLSDRERENLRRKELGFVFQSVSLIPSLSVQQNVEFSMRLAGEKNEKKLRSRAHECLKLVGLYGRKEHMPSELSGGEQQRVAIARALVNNPSMIIADEPTGNLDPARSLEIMMLLERINALGTTVMVVTHEKELVNRFTKRVVAINEGKVISDGMDGYYLNEEE